MTIVLSDINWGNYWQQECELINISSKKKEVIWHEKGLLGQSTERYIPLRDGLYLEISDYHIYKDMIVNSQYEQNNYDDVVVNFVVSGKVKTVHHGVTDYVLETAGKNYIEFWESRQETEHWFKGDRILKIRVGVDLNTLREMSHNYVETLPPEFQLLLAGQKLPPCYRLGNNNISINNVLHQILHCPYQGCTRNFYLESKALELFALWLEENISLQQIDQSSSLSRNDTEALQQVKEIMSRNLQNPPSLKELSRQLCLNESKLKSGFKQLFGTTIFGYLHTQRMEYARHLLREKRMKVTDVAQLSGYASLPSFSKAFRKYFAVSPNQYRNLP